MSRSVRRHWVPDDLWDIPPDDLSMAARALYVVLCRCTTKGMARVARARIGKMASMSRSAVTRAIAELEDAQMIEVRRRLKASSAYRVKPPNEWAFQADKCGGAAENLGPARTQIADGPIIIWAHRKADQVSYSVTVGSATGILQKREDVSAPSKDIETEICGWEEGRRRAAAAVALVRDMTAGLGPWSSRR